jgi:hypothetical protein
MKEEEKLEYRMMGLVPYNISPIQQGIQFGHAVVEYANIHGNKTEYKEWANNWKTFIILNGGTTNSKLIISRPTLYKGTLDNHLISLIDNKIDYAMFIEPDLNDALTAVVFLVDERVFNKEKYPDFILEDSYSNEEDANEAYKKWEDIIGGKKNVFLRNFLERGNNGKRFNLA